MSTEQNKVAVRRFIDEVFVKGNPDCGSTSSSRTIFTPPQLGEDAAGRRTAQAGHPPRARGLAEVRFKIEDMLAE
jgi:hypothetical protein